MTLPKFGYKQANLAQSPRACLFESQINDLRQTFDTHKEIVQEFSISIILVVGANNIRHYYHEKQRFLYGLKANVICRYR